MPLFNVQYPTSPSMPRYGPNDGPNAGNQYEGFGGGMVGSVGATQYSGSYDPRWGPSGPSFRPSAPAQPPVSAPARPTTTLPAPGARPATPSMSPADFFAQLAGLVGGASAGQFNPYARPNVQMSPEVRARMNAPVGPTGMFGNPMQGRSAPTGQELLAGMPRGLRPTEKNPTPWTSNKSWQNPRENPYARGVKFPKPSPEVSGPPRPADPLVFYKNQGGGPSNSAFRAAGQQEIPGYRRTGMGSWQNASGRRIMM